MEILSAVVRDANNNPLPNVPVRFKLEEGDAYFADTPGATPGADGKSITLTTDKNGVVGVRPTVGNTAGTIRVSASALTTQSGSFDTVADTVSGAQYYIRAKQAQDGPASFIGVVYTDKGSPLAGVRVSIGRTALSSTTDTEGKFQLDNVPPGRIDLFIDGRTTNPQNDASRAQYPSLHFEAYAVKGQQNQLAHAIYLPALAAAQGKVVGGNEDVILTIAGLEGFQMKVKANSVTFPDGSRVGTLIVSPVTADKLPMAPPAGGAQFGVPAWTIQPAGTRFDPPIEVQMPNATLEIPGDNLPVVQWDHDLNQYVPMGRATVSDDGAFLITDAGSGLTKAGWGGLCRYDECKTALTKCPDCQTIVMRGSPPCPSCVVDPSKDGLRLASLSSKISFEDAIKGPTTSLGRWIPVEWAVKVSANVAVLNDEICCSSGLNGRGEIKSIKASGDGDVSASVPYFIPLERALSLYSAASKTISNLKSLSDAVSPKLKIKLGFNGGFGGDYDGCKNVGQGNGSIGGTLEADFLSLSSKFEYTQKTLDNSVPVERTGELTPLEIGVEGTADMKFFDFPRNGLRGTWSLKGSFFAKSSVRFGTFSYNILNLRLPIRDANGPLYLPM